MSSAEVLIVLQKLRLCTKYAKDLDPDFFAALEAGGVGRGIRRRSPCEVRARRFAGNLRSLRSRLLLAIRSFLLAIPSLRSFLLAIPSLRSGLLEVVSRGSLQPTRKPGIIGGGRSTWARLGSIRGFCLGLGLLLRRLLRL